MADALHELPETIVLTRAEYRAQHAALEASLELLDRIPEADPDGVVRRTLDAALRIVLRRIWPFLEELDDGG